MDERLLARLRIITEEEQALLQGQGVQRERYTSGRDFVVDSEKLLEKGKLIEIRPHTRFVHFPRHRHNYVEMLYMCSGSTTHILNGSRQLELQRGDLLLLNQAVYHEILPAAEGDVGVNFIILPQFFDRSFRMLEQENVPVEMYQEFMGDIAKEIDRENQIITDLLSLVKMDKTGQNINIQSVNINELLEQILKRLKPIAEKKNVEMVMESFRPVTAEIDETKFSLAVSNLVENAIKYNMDNGWVHVSLNADHKFFYIKVEDSGIGIPEKDQDHIFERFYRVDKSHSREIGGTGLGLAIARNAVIVHRGSIKVHSIEGEGTTFTVRIPLTYVTV